MTSHVDDAEDDADVDGDDYGFVECEDGDAEVGSDTGPEAGAGSAVVRVDKVAQQSTGDSGHAATRQEVIENSNQKCHIRIHTCNIFLLCKSIRGSDERP